MMQHLTAKMYSNATQKHKSMHTHTHTCNVLIYRCLSDFNVPAK